ncbi:hypothetical protein LINPERPRIM_LOCUS39343 [Linum perenne]
MDDSPISTGRLNAEELHDIVRRRPVKRRRRWFPTTRFESCRLTRKKWLSGLMKQTLIGENGSLELGRKVGEREYGSLEMTEDLRSLSPRTWEGRKRRTIESNHS